MPPEEFDSLDAKSLKGLVLSLLAKIDELFEQNKTLIEQNSALLERIAELEGRGGKPPKNPKNLSLPPSSGQKGNVADNSGKKKCRKGRPGVARELCPNPDVTRDFFAECCGCGGKVPLKGQVLAHAYLECLSGRGAKRIGVKGCPGLVVEISSGLILFGIILLPRRVAASVDAKVPVLFGLRRIRRG